MSSACGTSCAFSSDTRAIIQVLVEAGLDTIRGPITPELAADAVNLIETGIYGTPGTPPDIYQTGTSGIRTTTIQNTVQSQNPNLVAFRASKFLVSAHARESGPSEEKMRLLVNDLNILAPEFPVNEGETKCIFVSPKKLQEEANVKDVTPEGILRFLTGGKGSPSRFPHVRQTTPARVFLQLIFEFAGNLDALFGESTWISLPNQLSSRGYAILGRAQGRRQPFLCFSNALPNTPTGSLIYSS